MLQGFFCLVVNSKLITFNHLTLQNTVKCFVIRIFFRSCQVCKLLSNQAFDSTSLMLHTNQPITASELDELDRMLFEQSGASTEEEFKKPLGEKPLGIFVRSILGMDSASAREAFSAFLSNAPLNSIQIEFINYLVRLMSQNGRVNPEMLFEQPFTKFHAEGLTGVFSTETRKKNH